MVRRVAKCTMSIQDNIQNAYKREPFRLVYGSEAIIRAEVGLTSYRVDNHDERKNDEAMRL